MLGFLNFTWIDFLDILVIAAVIFVAFRWIRGSTAINIFIAIVIVLVIRLLANVMGMKMVSSLLGTIIDVGAIALIVIFQPELRRFLNNIGRTAGTTIGRNNIIQKLFRVGKGDSIESAAISEIAEACKNMSAQMTGALIVIRHGNTLDDIISTGDTIDADIRQRLIMNIFFKNSPLHDGAMIIGGNRIIAARCTLPITEQSDLPAHFGMRHKAAVGITEQSDADVIVVSEQTGRISFVRAGTIKTIENLNDLKLLLGGANS